MTTSNASNSGTTVSLVRALGVADLTWLYLVAVVNLNIVPVVAAEGIRTLWLWGAGALALAMWGESLVAGGRRRSFSLGLTLLVVVCVALGLWWFRGSRALKLDTAYQAVLLDNGQVYYAKMDRLGNEYAVLTDVYYVEHQVDGQTKEVKNILIRRGNEWHAPNRTVVSGKHIVMVEPVTPGSKVAELIAELKRKDRS